MEKIPLVFRPYDPTRNQEPVRYELKAPPSDWSEEDQKALDVFIRDRRVLKRIEKRTDSILDDYI